MSTALARVRILAILVNLLYLIAGPSNVLWGQLVTYLTGQRKKTAPISFQAFYFVVDSSDKLNT
jgi:hypothetical protein